MPSSRPAQADEGNGSISTERSPLLGGLNGTVSGDGAIVEPENAQPTSEGASDDDEQIVLADEPSTKKLLAIMGALWLGVFFAALGTFDCTFPHPRTQYLSLPSFHMDQT